MAKVGESLIDAHNEALQNEIEHELARMKWYKSQLAVLGELVKMYGWPNSELEPECDEPIIVTKGTNNGEV